MWSPVCCDATVLKRLKNKIENFIYDIFIINTNYFLFLNTYNILFYGHKTLQHVHCMEYYFYYISLIMCKRKCG